MASKLQLHIQESITLFNYWCNIFWRSVAIIIAASIAIIIAAFLKNTAAIETAVVSD